MLCGSRDAIQKLIPSFVSHFTDAEKKDTLLQVVAPLSSSPSVVDEREASGPVPIHAGVSVFASILSPSSTVAHAFPAPAKGESLRKAYVHVVQTSGYNAKTSKGATVKINGGLELKEGDGAFAMGKSGDKLEIENIGDVPAELIVFDIE